MRQCKLGPPLVQISATTLVFASFLFVTVAARHLLRFTCLRYSLHLLLNVGSIPNNLNLYRRSGLFICPFPTSVWEAIKPPVPLPFPFSDLDFRIAFSFISTGPPSFLYGISASTTDYSLRHCLANNRSFAFQMFSPISVFDIRNRRNIHTSCRTASIFPFWSILDISYGNQTPLSTIVHIPSKQSRQCLCLEFGDCMKESAWIRYARCSRFIHGFAYRVCLSG